MSAVSLAVPAVAPDPAILVVDDNPVKRVAIRAMLAPLGYAVVEADSGRAALRALERQTFALILMDVRMPTLDGYETAKLSRRADPRRTHADHLRHRPWEVTRPRRRAPMPAAPSTSSSRRSCPNVLRAKVTAFVDLFVQSQELQRSLESITTLNAALRDSEVRTQAVLDNVADGDLHPRRGGRDRTDQPLGRPLFGYHAGEPVGHPFAFMIAPERRDELPGSDAVRTLREGVPPNRSTETRRLPPGRLHLPVELERGEMQHGERTFTLVCVRDISERRPTPRRSSTWRSTTVSPASPIAPCSAICVARALASAKRARRAARRAGDGSRRLQAGQRHARTRSRRHAAQAGRRNASSKPCARATPLPDSAGTSSRSCQPRRRDLPAAAAVALKIQQACEQAFVINGETMHVSPSIGIALFPEHGTTTRRTAPSSRSGDVRGQAIAGTATRCSTRDRRRNTADRLALLQSTCVAVSAATSWSFTTSPRSTSRRGRITGVEALVRWHHPSQGLLSPASFMPEVERTQLIAPVTRWVLNAALAPAADLARRGLRPDDGRQRLRPQPAASEHAPRNRGRADPALGHRARPADARAHRERADRRCRPGRPEPSARAWDRSCRSTTSATGYSSLAYLQRLPVEEIKIDRVVRHEPRIRQRRRDHRALDDRTRPQPRPDGRRRGRRGCGRCKNPR